MILGSEKILELIKKKKLIENIPLDDFHIEGCSIDLHLGELYEMSRGKGFLHKEERKTPSYKLVAEYERGKRKFVKIKPGKYYIATTLEKINVPKNLFAIFIPRGTFYASGILVLGLRAEPGYKGKFRFHLFNLTNKEFEIEMGCRVASVIFLEVKGKTIRYSGEWQGGRVFIGKKEKMKKRKLKFE